MQLNVCRFFKSKIKKGEKGKHWHISCIWPNFLLCPHVLWFMPCVLCQCLWWVGRLLWLFPFFPRSIPDYVTFLLSHLFGRSLYYMPCSPFPCAIGQMGLFGRNLNLVSLPCRSHCLFYVWTVANCGLHIVCFCVWSSVCYRPCVSLAIRVWLNIYCLYIFCIFSVNITHTNIYTSVNSTMFDGL